MSTLSGTGAQSFWKGSASVQILSNAIFHKYKKTFVDVKDVMIDWGGGGPPPGATNSTLTATYAQGLQVGYKTRYELTGAMHTDAGQSSFFNVSNVNAFTGDTYPDINIRQDPRWYWEYGPRQESFYVVNQPSVAGSFYYWASSSERVPYRAYNMNWTIHYDIIVARSCTVANIGSQTCVDLCLNNPDTCSDTYSTYCLDPKHPERIGTDVCKDYYSNVIDIKGSNNLIDRQVVRYCATKYHGFTDLDPDNPDSTIPREQRLYDLTICACNLTEDVTVDPDAEVLYNRYFNDLVKQVPAYSALGEQKKCLYNPCASSEFRPLPIPIGGCKTPKCVNNVTVINDGRIEGNVTISTTCGTDTYGIIALVICIILIIIALIVFYFYLSQAPPLPSSMANSFGNTGKTTTLYT